MKVDYTVDGAYFLNETASEVRNDARVANMAAVGSFNMDRALESVSRMVQLIVNVLSPDVATMTPGNEASLTRYFIKRSITPGKVINIPWSKPLEVAFQFGQQQMVKQLN